MDSADDLSFQATASQFPMILHSSIHSYEAKNAVDRNTTTCMRTDAIGIGTSASSKHMWWKVDLGAVYNIYSIDILFKDYGHVGMYVFAFKTSDT